MEIPNIEMMIDHAWNTRNWSALAQYEPILKKSENMKHKLYHMYLAINVAVKSGNFTGFDEIFKSAISLAVNRWDLQLPKYVDSVHFESMVLFQLVMEGNEGGRNMIKEAQASRARGKMVDLKTAVNIWRERVPSKYEGMHIWKEVLENRNFI